MSRWEAVIGLEVHAQLSTESKLFSTCATAYGARPNDQTNPVCLGLPGALPVPNERAVDYAMRLGLALGCTIAERSEFARKNYFYPDLPKNYQISQYEHPVCEGGAVPIEVEGERSEIPLERIHLEEDAGKLIHDPASGRTRVDLNRTGTPLVEIVSRPALRDPEQAGAYLNSLRQLVRWLGICDGNMEEGSLRCDANVSLRPVGQEEFGTKVEVKNLNSIRGVVDALRHEIERQAKVLDTGGVIEQETRGWDPDRGVTVFQRGKEFAHDYRYFPDPDLPPLRIDRAWRERVATGLPELPFARRDRMAGQYGLGAAELIVLTESRELADWFEATVAAGAPAREASNWIQTEVLRLLNERDGDFAALPLSPEGLAGLLARIEDGSISGKIAKQVLEEMVAKEESADAVIERLGLKQISDEGALVELAGKILDENPAQVQQYLGGKESVLAFFVGQMMKATRGQANPKLANQVLAKALEERR